MKKHRILQAALLIWITALSLLSPAFADSTTPRHPIRPPHIGTDGRLILPAPQIFPRLPTEVHTFFPNHHAYHYDARLYQEGIGKIGSTEGYTLSGDRAYNEIESILGRTPRWGEWAKDIQKQKAQKGGIQILGQLSKTGPQTTGDYNGYAEFDTYGKNTRANVQYEVFDKLLPLINNYNHLAERLEQTDYLTPQEKAPHLDTHLQTQRHPILPSNPQHLKDLSRGITRTRQIREIIGTANQPQPLTPEQLTQIGQNTPYLDPSLSYLAHHTQRAEANFTANQQDSWQRWNGETPNPPHLSPYGQQLNRSSGALDHLIGDRSTYLIQRSGLDEAAARAYRNLVPTDIQATVSQGQAAAARFSEDNPDFAAAFGYGTRVAGVAGGVKGIEKAVRALPRLPRTDGLPRADSLPPTGRFFRESKLPPVSHDFAEAAEAMFRSRHPEVAPAQSKAAGGNTNKGRMHTGGRERQPESKFRQQHNVPNSEKPEITKPEPSNQFPPPHKGLSIPQGITPQQFDNISRAVRRVMDERGLGDDAFVMGSRAAGTAKPSSDIDIGIRVSPDKFNEEIERAFKNSQNARARTKDVSIRDGRIHSGEAGFDDLKTEISKLLGATRDKVQISIIKKGGKFDNGAQTPLSFDFHK